MADYTGSLPGVRALLPHRTIDAESKPSQDDVSRYLATVRGMVAGRIGPADLLPDLYGDGATMGRRAELIASAGGVIDLGAAAMTEDASFPERADPTASSRYGAVLWERFRQALDELAVAAGGSTEDGIVVVGGAAAAGIPAASFPAPAGFGTVAW